MFANKDRSVSHRWKPSPPKSLSSIQVYCCNSRRILYELPKRRVSAMEYSPRDTYLLLFEPFTSMWSKLGIAWEQALNCRVFPSSRGRWGWKTESNDLQICRWTVGCLICAEETKRLVWVHRYSIVAKSVVFLNCRAPIWSNDESMFGRLQISQVWFYQLPDFGKRYLQSKPGTYQWFSDLERYAHRLTIEGLQMFSLGKSNQPYTVAAYIKGKKVTQDPFAQESA